VHIHSGKFDTWLAGKSKKYKQSVKSGLRDLDVKVVVLSEDWVKLLKADLGDLTAISNPLNPKYSTILRKNTEKHLLLLGRNDPVKGHRFAVEIALQLKRKFPDLVMTMTGVEESEFDWILARGWVTESEKMRLLSTASVLLLPSKYEGQPMVAIESLASGLPVVADSRLHSLPKEVSFAGPDLESWCRIVTDALEDPQSIKFDSSEYDLEAVRSNWKNLYASLIDS
jgi:glycosyltransferase involved in cell wall biosynthesis